MAVYKVAQDVEADDKLIGPFSFRQFIYLIIVAISIALAWGLSRVFVGLAIIPLPLILFFGALALPLRKDQPMEVYLAALLSYYLKPRKRLWTPDGIESLIEITAPKVMEVQRTKAITELEAERRLSYLADIADTRGWAVRHSVQPAASSSMITDAYFEAQQTEDVLDDNGGVAQSFEAMISQADERRRQEMMARMHQTNQPSSTTQPSAPPSPQTSSQRTVDDGPSPQFNPYPTSIHQSVIQPLNRDSRIPTAEPAPANKPTAPTSRGNTQPDTSEKPLSPDIISLANNTDLSIETIQREADRIRKKEDEGEVFISLH